MKFNIELRACFKKLTTTTICVLQDDDQNVSTTKCDLSFQALINLDMVPIKLAPITIDNRFYAAEGPPRNGRNALPRGIHPAQSAVLAFTNAGEQWILTCQVKFSEREETEREREKRDRDRDREQSAPNSQDLRNQKIFFPMATGQL